MRLQRQPTIEIAAQPIAARLLLPVDGMLGHRVLPPTPTGITPEPPLTIATFLDEGGKLLLCHQRPRHGEWLNFHRMRPLLVIEHERLIRSGPEPKSSSMNLHIPRQRTRTFCLLLPD